MRCNVLHLLKAVEIWVRFCRVIADVANILCCKFWDSITQPEPSAQHGYFLRQIAQDSSVRKSKANRCENLTWRVPGTPQPQPVYGWSAQSMFAWQQRNT